MISLAKTDHLFQCVVPAVTVTIQGVAGMEQRAVPAEVEALEAALVKLENTHDAWGPMMPDSLEDAVWIAINVLRQRLSLERRRASTGGNSELNKTSP